jgi:hypothetical protein
VGVEHGGVLVDFAGLDQVDLFENVAYGYEVREIFREY